MKIRGRTVYTSGSEAATTRRYQQSKKLISDFKKIKREMIMSVLFSVFSSL